MGRRSVSLKVNLMTKDLDSENQPTTTDDIWSRKASPIEANSSLISHVKEHGLPVFSEEETLALAEKAELRAAAFIEDTLATKKIRKRRAKGAPKPPKVRVQKESDERYTPEDVLDVVRAVGTIVLDPCSTPANRTKATYFYTFEDDGLSKDWWELTRGGLIFVNPPFSNLKGWVNKFAEEAAKGCNIVVLTPGDTSTLWFQEVVWLKSSAVCFWKGRIEFIRTAKAFGTKAMQPTLFVFFGKQTDLFEKAFSPHGRVLKRLNNTLVL